MPIGRFLVLKYLYVVTVVLFCFINVSAQTPSNNIKVVIENHVGGLSDELTELSNSSAMKSTIRKAVPALRSMIKKHSEVYSLIRTNSKGKVVNEEVSSGSKGTKFRDVSSQGWYGITAENKSYYNYYKKRNGDFYLFWCEPIKIRLGDGRYRFGGAMVAKIDLQKCIENATPGDAAPFLFTADDGFKYAGDWKDSYKGKVFSLKIKGLEKAELFVYRPKESSSVSAEEAAVKTEKSVEKKDEKNKTKGVSMIISVLMIIVVLTVAAAAVWYIKHLSHNKNKKLMSDIDGEDNGGYKGEPNEEFYGKENEAKSDFDNTGFENDKNEDPFVTDKTVYIKNPIHHIQNEINEEDSSHEELPHSEEKEIEDKLRSGLNKEYAEKFEKALAEREEIIRSSIYKDVRNLFVQNIKGYTEMLDREIQSISSLASQEDIPQNLRDILSTVYNHLKKLRDSLRIDG